MIYHQKIRQALVIFTSKNVAHTVVPVTKAVKSANLAFLELLASGSMDSGISEMDGAAVRVATWMLSLNSATTASMSVLALLSVS